MNTEKLIYSRDYLSQVFYCVICNVLCITYHKWNKLCNLNFLPVLVSHFAKAVSVGTHQDTSSYREAFGISLAVEQLTPANKETL